MRSQSRTAHSRTLPSPTCTGYLEWRRGEGLARCRCHVVLQGICQVVRVGVEEVLREVDELEQAQVAGFSNLPGKPMGKAMDIASRCLQCGGTGKPGSPDK